MELIKWPWKRRAQSSPSDSDELSYLHKIRVPTIDFPLNILKMDDSFEERYLKIICIYL